MFKYRRLFFTILVLIFIFLTLIEAIYYFIVDSNLFGMIYLIINLLIIFLIIPALYNYKDNYSTLRCSKLLIVFVIGMFNSYILNNMVISRMNYIDASIIYNDKIFIIKNILKLFIYLGFLLLSIRDGKILKRFKIFINNKMKKSVD